jgi:hypothetical protein
MPDLAGTDYVTLADFRTPLAAALGDAVAEA